MFEKPPEFEKPHRSEEAEGAPMPPRSLWEPVNAMRLVGIAVAVVVVVILLTRAFYQS